MSHKASFRFAQRFAQFTGVQGTLPNGEEVQGDFLGVTPDGMELLQVRVWNLHYPLGMIVPFHFGSLRPASKVPALEHAAPMVEPPAPVVERPAPVVVLSIKDFPALPKAAPAVPRVHYPAPARPSPAPKVEPPAPKYKRTPSSPLLDEAAIQTVVSKTVLAALEGDLRARMVHTTHDLHRMSFSCPPFAFVDVNGRMRRASIHHTLGKMASEIRKRVIQQLGFVPPGTYIRFDGNFKRGDEGKLLEEDGVMNVFLQW